MERRNNIEKAITCYHAALQVFTYESNPTKYATIHMNLGIAYAGRIAGVRWKNQKRQFPDLERALGAFPSDTPLEEKATALGNLGMAMSVAP